MKKIQQLPSDNLSCKQPTLMEEQYLDVKKQYPDCLLFYRLGDFYELFNDDAVVASKLLGLVLTHRQSMPMCGIPWHAHETYLARLVKEGYRIAICEQIETPQEAKLRGNKGPVARRVTRIISSGTVIEDALLDSKNNNWLLAITVSKDKAGLAYADISGGRFFIEEVSKQDIISCVMRINPSEIICSDTVCSEHHMLAMLERYKQITHIVPDIKYDIASVNDRLARFYNVRFINSFFYEKYSLCVMKAVAMIADYVAISYMSGDICKVSLGIPKSVNSDEYMLMDGFTQKSLEIEVTQLGEYAGSLLSCIDTTETTQGARTLARWLKSPLANLNKIETRLNYVEFFVKSPDILKKISSVLACIPDMERSVSRIIMKKCSPRDIKAVQTGLQNFVLINEVLKQNSTLLSLSINDITILEIIKKLEGAIIDTPPLLARDGGFIQYGYDKQLDEYTDLLNNSEILIKQIQSKYISETGISTLKIKSNGIWGYFIEINSGYANRMNEKFIHRQTLSNCIRYTTKELSETANNIYSAEADAKQRELFIFDELTNYLISLSDILREVSDKISFIDVITSFARNANERHYVRPIFNQNNRISIKAGRHPVVERSLQSSGNKFISNNYESNDNITLLTGPNMGGKSTYLRQNALIIVMAQIGSFVPADFADLTVVDRIFSRVGASDDIASGKSTFMVEMIETATILNQATNNSFIILDEIGRGTSTQDGLAIAWATVEELANNIKANTIFATHYHELSGIELPNIQFAKVQISASGSDIVFLYKIVPGFMAKSFGLHVAALAGFPKHVLERAKQIMNKLPKSKDDHTLIQM